MLRKPFTMDFHMLSIQFTSPEVKIFYTTIGGVFQAVSASPGSYGQESNLHVLSRHCARTLLDSVLCYLEQFQSGTAATVELAMDYNIWSSCGMLCDIILNNNDKFHELNEDQFKTLQSAVSKIQAAMEKHHPSGDMMPEDLQELIQSIVGAKQN